VTDGFVVLFKPIGITSSDAVSKVRKLFGQKAGHAGTLDPAAEGVLPIALGAATRFLEVLENCDKAYLARVTFGVVTDTFDADGQVVRGPEPIEFTLEDLLAVLRRFTGRVQHRPPPFSAVKVHGRRLHRLARQGRDVQPPLRTVQISSLRLLGWLPPHLYLLVECGRGIYVRSIAHDLGQALGCGAYLSYLLRLRHGPFYLGEAIRLEQLGAARKGGWIERLVLPPEDVLTGRAIAAVGISDEKTIGHGAPIKLPSTSPVPEAVALGANSRALAVLRPLGNDLWHPRKVFARLP
jgi:tRNA pseudouridine55 synthase